MEFSGCGFDGQETVADGASERINISMPDTAIGTLEFFIQETSARIILLSVCSIEANFTRYYHDATEDDPSLEITKAQFDQLQETVDRKDYMLIAICAKSIRNLSFSACIYIHDRCDLEDRVVNISLS